MSAEAPQMTDSERMVSDFPVLVRVPLMVALMIPLLISGALGGAICAATRWYEVETAWSTRPRWLDLLEGAPALPFVIMAGIVLGAGEAGARWTAVILGEDEL